MLSSPVSTMWISDSCALSKTASFGVNFFNAGFEVIESIFIS
jgi:hypothetical protein